MNNSAVAFGVFVSIGIAAPAVAQEGVEQCMQHAMEVFNIKVPGCKNMPGGPPVRNECISEARTQLYKDQSACHNWKPDWNKKG
jgi:hypothetical protein